MQQIAHTPGWLTLPFFALLGLVAMGPVFFPKLWHRIYPLLVPVLGIGVVAYQLIALDDLSGPAASLMDYVSFMACVLALYMSSSGIWLDLHLPATPLVNSAILVIGGLLSNLIGTTGASVLLIRPFMRINQGRLRPFHIVFFIFLVSNVGGSLFFLGDAPIFLGYLKGVPAVWTLVHHSWVWLVSVGLLTLIFYLLDRRVPRLATPQMAVAAPKPAIEFRGLRNFIWLGLLLVTLLLDPNIIPGVPTLALAGHHFSYLREIGFLLIAAGAYLFADKKVLAANRFSMAPMVEVMILFFGIFATMGPALELLRHYAMRPDLREWMSPDLLFWLTGLCSAVLDNAPTYVTFLNAGMGATQTATVAAYAAEHVPHLLATGLGAIFFGAMTYIGNGPNFMVKSVAEQQGVKMPSFFGYLVCYAVPFLLPVLTLVWLLFIRG